MMGKLLVLAAGGAGYVLGARAGRGRYEELRDAFDKVRHDPRVQEKARQAADTVREQAPQVAGSVKNTVSGSGPDESVGSDLDPDRIRLGDDTGPQGTLP